MQGAVRLNGTGSPITLRADQGEKAVYNITTYQNPVSGTAFDDYKCVTGAPDTASVVYRLEHNYGTPTYTWNGSSCTAKVTCSDCISGTKGHTVTETVTGIYSEDTPATCAEPSKGHYRTIFLNVLFEDQNTEANSVNYGSTLGHDFSGSWEPVDENQHKRTCTRCKTETEYANHAWTNATCTAPKMCVECQKTVGNPNGHTLTDATCTTPPYCLVCHEYVGDPLGHLLTAPDCTVAEFCLRCHETISPALGHDWGAWTSISETQHQRMCKRDETHKETADHTWNDGKVTKAATHEAEGILTYTCTKCGETKTETIDKLTEHAFDQKTVSEQYLKSEATCTEAAVYYKSCECGEASTTETFTSGNPLGHNFPDTWEQHNAEQHKHTCTRCGTEVEYADHNFDGNTCKDCGYVKGSDYIIIAGSNGVWTKGSTAGLAFTSNAPFAKFDSVKVDGSTIAATNYTAEEGSTKITLAPAYLETLSEDSHSIEIVSKDGSAFTSFTVKGKFVPPAPAYYTVTFNMNGHGDQVAAQSVESAGKATKPADPKASGYTFSGWYADAACSTKFDFSSAITANTTVYAKWTQNSVVPTDPPIPQTGDNSNMFLWLALLLVSGGALAGTSTHNRKKKKNKIITP